MKYSRSDIAKAFVASADKIGTKKATKNLAALLLEQGMHGRIDEIMDDIAAQFAKLHGVMEANVKTAYPLSAEVKKDIEARVKKETSAKKVIINETIDRSLLGGVIITAPDMELDLSLKTKLAKLKA